MPTVLAVFVVLLFVWLVPKRQVNRVKNNPETKGPLELENDYRQTLVQVVGGIAIFVTVYAAFDSAKMAHKTLALSVENVRLASQSYDLARRGQVADRMFKAMEMLSKHNTDAKVAAVYSLEQVADEDPQCEWPIVETLFNYLRVHERWSGRSHRGAGDPLPPDASAILDFVRRRPWEIKEDGRDKCIEYHQCVDYQKGQRPSEPDPDYYKIINIPGVDFRNAFLERAMLKMVIVGDAHLERARLRYGHFEGSYAAHSILRDADLRESYWNWANLEGADLTCSRWNGADLDHIFLKNARLFGADLTGVRNLSKQAA